jgi:hypothetical protein
VIPLERRIRVAALLPLLIAPLAAHAAWNPDGNPVCTAVPSQAETRAVSDGTGGLIVTWTDLRNGGWDVYAQRLNAAGEPMWAPDGIPVCIARGDQDPLLMVSDGAGGAVVVWHDYRCGSSVYAQRIDVSGAPVWSPNGVPVTVTSAGQWDPRAVPDGAGGVIVVWLDGRGGCYGQRIDAGGQRRWGADGVLVTTGSNVSLDADGAGGAVLAFTLYGGPAYIIGVQAVDSSGSSRWPGGMPVCNSGSNADQSAILSDRAGGAIVTWTDGRAGNYPHIFAQRIGSAGAPQWTLNGIALCDANGGQDSPAIVTDGGHGALVVWLDHRYGSSVAIFGRRIDAAGDTLWQTYGNPICVESGTRSGQRLLADGAGGAIVAWQDGRNGRADVYAQRVAGDGRLHWTPSGIALCAAPGDQTSPAIATDGRSGAIVAWNDARVSASQVHVYAVRVDSAGGAASNVGVNAGVVPRFRMLSAAPNPAHDGVRMAFALPAAAVVSADVFDLGGRRVRSLGARLLAPGTQSLEWDSRDNAGAAVPAGLYFVRVRAGGAEGRCHVVITR